MNNNVLFKCYELPPRLSDEEENKLLDEIKSGNKEAKKKLAVHNIRYVIYLVNLKFANVEYDKNDLVDIGICGLLNAIDTFNPDRGTFSAYSKKCIINEILQFLNKLKKSKNDIFFEDMKYEVVGNNAILDFERLEILKVVRKSVNNLPEREREIILMSFGFYNDRIYLQREIGEKLNMPQPFISKKLKKTLTKLRIQLEKDGVIELRKIR